MTRYQFLITHHQFSGIYEHFKWRLKNVYFLEPVDQLHKSTRWCQVYSLHFTYTAYAVTVFSFIIEVISKTHIEVVESEALYYYSLKATVH